MLPLFLSVNMAMLRACVFTWRFQHMGAIIWLASYPKSGNTWVRSFLHNLLRNTQDSVDLDELDHFCLGESDLRWYARHLSGDPETASVEMIAKVRSKGQQDMTQAFPDSVFVKTHNYLGDWNGYPLHNMGATAGGIYVLRNPLDVVLSVTHHFGVDIDGAIERMAHPNAGSGLNDKHIPEVHSSWSTNVKSWTGQPNPSLFAVRYEDLLDKPNVYFKNMAHFLGLNPPKERLKRAIENASFKKLKALEEEKGFKEKSKHSKSFFREGKAEQWREQLSESQIKRIVADHREQMERFNYVPEGY